jgi:hypothetical protein
VRSIRSRILCDERTGGLSLDHGYLRVRPLAPGRWQVTTRKIVKFSGRPWLDHIAPATLRWWLENETFDGRVR